MAQSRIRAVLVVVALTAVMWLLQISRMLVPWDAASLGIWPRETDSFATILTSPFIHANWAHLLANTVPLLVLGALVAFSGLGRFAAASIIIVLVSGLGVWLISPAGVPTVGASGLIFGYFGYLVLRGIIERKVMDIVIMICVVLFYGGLIFGVLPQEGPISWQGHLFGFLGGLLAAYVLPRRERTAIRQSPYPRPY
ncbi:rhomboid family intramembrane serine protease [Lipingzhangella sp. LS1_29]|uniref:Rhomboid family intramembrane serine protease n=1 Tax=Lipingzhangella rawalii TaxID=2055835 RepID=A0ABU2HAF7_9ACTN|nr:rhomboid family intramembrane serine protease [Lipingzhangella rawalii]MDS1271579.1 rhomboid family intramembrane serine protease [Lipingzhangella rawalii]